MTRNREHGFSLMIAMGKPKEAGSSRAGNPAKPPIRRPGMESLDEDMTETPPKGPVPMVKDSPMEEASEPPGLKESMEPGESPGSSPHTFEAHQMGYRTEDEICGNCSHFMGVEQPCELSKFPIASEKDGCFLFNPGGQGQTPPEKSMPPMESPMLPGAA